MHVSRGVSFIHTGGGRYRYYGVETFRRPDWGFRVVREIDVPPDSKSSAADRAGKSP